MTAVTGTYRDVPIHRCAYGFGLEGVIGHRLRLSVVPAKVRRLGSWLVRAFATVE